MILFYLFLCANIYIYNFIPCYINHKINMRPQYGAKLRLGNINPLMRQSSGRPPFGLVSKMKSFDQRMHNSPFLKDTNLPLEEEDPLSPAEQGGTGILDIISASSSMASNALNKGQLLLSGAQAIGNIATGPIGTAVSNKLSQKFNNNDKWRPGFPGEKHLVLNTDSGFTRANYCGPGTNILKRLRRGDEGVSDVDSACKIHDLLYSTAKNKQDIRAADNRLLSDINKSSSGVIQKNILRAGLKTKTLGEDIGVFSPTTFTDIPSLQVGSGKLANGMRGGGAITDLRKELKQIKEIIPTAAANIRKIANKGIRKSRKRVGSASKKLSKKKLEKMARLAAKQIIEHVKNTGKLI